uniref:SAM-dependent MTase TRM10-type domain-containing protein n=3 Tax=Meloidogyne TaxID=189290 RepID=A0A6V7VSH0_MELEN|nr:unnamed protein product [Meloidogyne enterolobii]
MLSLDSFTYRLLWRLKSFLRFRNRGPQPIIYNASCRKFIPPSNFESLLDKEKMKNFVALKDELNILSRIFNQLPEKLDERDWHSLVQLSDTKDRFFYLRFLYKREKKRTNEEIKLKFEENKKQKLPINHQINKEEQSLIYLRNSHIDLLQKRLATNKIIEAFRLKEEYPIIAIDCRWLHLHSERGLNLACKQLKYLIGRNRDREIPWPLYLTNFIKENNSKIEEAKRKHFSIINGNFFTAHITSKSYLELFPELKEKQKIVYLSPHSKEPLESVEPNTCYVIGGIVDAFSEPEIPSKASIEVATQEGIQCKRLNLDYRQLKGGNPMFTLDQVLDILHDVYHKSEWEETIRRYVPKRKFESKSEKNLLVKSFYKNTAERNRQIIGILQKNCGVNQRTTTTNAYYHTSTNCFKVKKELDTKISTKQLFDGTIRRKTNGEISLEKKQNNYKNNLMDLLFPKMLFDYNNLQKIIGFAVALDVLILSIIFWLDKKEMDDEEKQQKMDILYFLLFTINLIFCLFLRKKIVARSKIVK